MATTHLICGLPCSGKTTYASALRADLDGVLFTLDRWLITLFGRYSIDDVGHQEHVRRVLACRELIWSAAAELHRRGADVILDDGFFLRENRMRTISLARGVGAGAKTHFINTPMDILQSRLALRNAHLPPFNFPISPEMLRGFVSLFEIPGADEGAGVVVVRDVGKDHTVTGNE